MPYYKQTKADFVLRVYILCQFYYIFYYVFMVYIMTLIVSFYLSSLLENNLSQYIVCSEDNNNIVEKFRIL